MEKGAGSRNQEVRQKNLTCLLTATQRQGACPDVGVGPHHHSWGCGVKLLEEVFEVTDYIKLPLSALVDPTRHLDKALIGSPYPPS